MKKNMVLEADQMMRFRIMNRGIIASSPLRCSQNRKMPKATPAPTKRPITVEEFHGYSDEPNWRARRNIMDAGAKIAKPTRSSCGIIERMSANETGGLTVWSGTCIEARKMPARPPRGRLM